MMFWFTLIHFVIFGILAFASFSEFEPIGGALQFHLRELGLLNAASVWLFWQTPFVDSALVTGDIAALFMAWRWAHRVPCRRRTVVAYLVLGLAALHAAGAANAGWIGSFHSSSTRGVDIVIPLLISDVFYVLPALLILAALIFREWPTRPPGLCVSCGYDLTGNASGICPECGTPATET